MAVATLAEVDGPQQNLTGVSHWVSFTPTSFTEQRNWTMHFVKFAGTHRAVT